MDAVITTYPLSADFRDRLAGLIHPDAIRLNLTELRQLPIGQMLRRLRAIKVTRVLVPLEDEGSTALLPVLQSIAVIIPAQHYLYVDAQLRTRAFSPLAVPGSMIQVSAASLAGAMAVHRARNEVETLLAAPRVDVEQAAQARLMFLNANLWFGVKAGGSVGHVSGVVNGFLECGWAVDYASVGGKLLVKPTAYYAPLAPPKHFGFPWEANYYAFHFDAVRQVQEYFHTHRPRLLYQRLSIANYAGVTVSRALKLPLVMEYNGSEAWVAKNWGSPLREQALAERVEEVSLRHAHLIVTISDVLRDELLARNVPPERIVTYPNCIDPAMFDPGQFSAAEIATLRGKHSIAEDALVVTFVGTFGQWHGAPVLAKAVRKILDDHSDLAAAHKLHFLFVGDGLKMPEVRELLGRHNSGTQVTLTGLVSQDLAPLYLAASNILVSPHVPNSDGSRFFGSPTKLFEYMAMGKAIVASDLDQIGDVLNGSMHAAALPNDSPLQSAAPPAILTEPGSVAEIIRSIFFLSERPDFRQALGANARRLALEKYTWRHHVLAIVERMQQLGMFRRPDA